MPRLDTTKTNAAPKWVRADWQVGCVQVSNAARDNSFVFRWEVSPCQALPQGGGTDPAALQKNTR